MGSLVLHRTIDPDGATGVDVGSTDSACLARPAPGEPLKENEPAYMSVQVGQSGIDLLIRDGLDWFALVPSIDRVAALRPSRADGKPRRG